MSKLKLLDPNKARAYGVPETDTTQAALEKHLTDSGMTKEQAAHHLKYVLTAGVYEGEQPRTEPVAVAKEKA